MGSLASRHGYYWRILEPMPLPPNSRVGRYEVICAIGSRGVCRARDSQSARDVALLILQKDFASDDDRVQFDRAVGLSELAHPSIVDAHIEEIEPGTHVLVTEYVDGESLSQRIARGPMPLDEAMPIARQVASALAAAHAREVTHRQLTPASVRVRANGRVGVLGFGLAALMEAGVIAPSSNAVYAAAGLGMPAQPIPAPMGPAHESIAGRTSYMSPEQVRGGRVDKRTDIWSFGALLFATLAGRHPFAGADARAARDAVEHDEPDWKALPPNLPPLIANLIRQCLEKNPNARISDIAKVRFRLNASAAPPIASQSTAILDGVAAWIQRRPRVMRAFSGLGRRIAPILPLARRHVFVLGADEVRDALGRGSDFELGPFGGPKMLMGPFLLGMDPREQYHRERDLLEEILGALVKPLKTIAEEESTRQAAALANKHSIDVVNEFAEPIVARVARRFFGIDFPLPTDTIVLAPANGEELLSQWVRKVGSVIATTSPAPFGLQRVAEACAAEFRAYLEREIWKRVEDPQPDTVLGLLLQRVNAGKLPRERVLPNLAGLMLAGSTPLVKSITHAIDQVLRHPDQIPADPDDEALERLLFEALRFNPTFPIVLRYCPFTKILGGQARRTIPAGASLYVTLIGALFDPEINDADHFAADRPTDENSSLVFGSGQHQCLGRHVATTELIEILGAFLKLPDVRQFQGSRIHYDGPAADRFVIKRKRA